MRGTFVRASAAALFITASSPAVFAQPRAANARSTVTAASRLRIDNFGQVSPTYFRGAQPRGGDYTDLASLGVRTVINLTGDDADGAEKALTERAGMRYVQIPMTTRVVPTASQLAQFMRIVTDPAQLPVYVHCVGGRHRTGVMTAVYRITHDGWSSEQAFKEMKRYKFGADFLHPEFKKFVFQYPAMLAQAAPAAAAAVATKSGS